MVLVWDFFFPFILPDNVCAWPMKVKLFPSESNLVCIYQDLIWRGSVCLGIYINTCIHKCVYVCVYTYTGEKKELCKGRVYFLIKGRLFL